MDDAKSDYTARAREWLDVRPMYQRVAVSKPHHDDIASLAALLAEVARDATDRERERCAGECVNLERERVVSESDGKKTGVAFGIRATAFRDAAFYIGREER
jgi:hypothetical protein